jgi:hypothetical protein
MKKYTITVQYDNGVVKEHVVRSTASTWFVIESLLAHKNQKVLNMKREFIDKNGNSWEWEESAETVAAVEQLHKPKFAGNYNGPLYAPHPDIKKDENQ